MLKILGRPTVKRKRARSAHSGTYVNYVDALRILLGDLDQSEDPPAILTRICFALAALHPHQESLKGLFIARWLNLKAMSECSSQDLAQNWLLQRTCGHPFKAYYSIHDVVCGRDYRLTASTIRKHITSSCGKPLCNLWKDSLPHPFDVTCVGYSTLPNKPKYALRGTAISEADCRRMSVLSVPTDLDAEALFVKAIVTTHDRRLEEACQRFRERKGLRRLTASQRLLCATKVSPTSIFHFLYRLRLRSNYDDPRYVFGWSDQYRRCRSTLHASLRHRA